MRKKVEYDWLISTDCNRNQPMAADRCG